MYRAGESILYQNVLFIHSIYTLKSASTDDAQPSPKLSMHSSARETSKIYGPLHWTYMNYLLPNLSLPLFLSYTHTRMDRHKTRALILTDIRLG